MTDLDNDGRADVLLVGRWFFYVLRGLRGGRFAYANDDWHLPNQAWAAVDEGLCFGDVTGDGRLDLITCGPGPDGRNKGVRAFRNDLPGGHWLRVRLLGAKGNRSAAGAKIRVHAPAAKTGPRRLLAYEQVCLWGRQSFHSYYAAARTERHVGLGQAREGGRQRGVSSLRPARRAPERPGRRHDRGPRAAYALAHCRDAGAGSVAAIPATSVGPLNALSRSHPPVTSSREHRPTALRPADGATSGRGIARSRDRW